MTSNTEQRNDAVRKIIREAINSVLASHCGVRPVVTVEQAITTAIASLDALALSQPPAPSLLEGEVRDLVDMLERRIGQDFDGECHLAEHEARQIIAALSTEAGSGEVPAEATDAMVEAGLTTGTRFGPQAMRNIWRTMYSAAIAEAGKPAPSEPVAFEKMHPSLEMCVQWSEDGQHIRKWSRLPFDGGECLYSHPVEPAPSEDRLREALDKACNTLCGLGYPNIASNIREFAALSGSAVEDKGGEKP